jgi:hypothetical protein
MFGSIRARTYDLHYCTLPDLATPHITWQVVSIVPVSWLPGDQASEKAEVAKDQIMVEFVIMFNGYDTSKADAEFFDNRSVVGEDLAVERFVDATLDIGIIASNPATSSDLPNNTIGFEVDEVVPDGLGFVTVMTFRAARHRTVRLPCTPA